jgi:tartrate dehydrogenase/decarboxylase/D-malate dehydrogenase
MMLEHLGESAGSKKLMAALEWVTAQGILTPDLGGKVRTREFTDAVLAAIEGSLG